LADGVVDRDGEVVVTAATDVAGDPGVILRAAAAAASLDMPIGRGSLERLRDEAPPPPEPWPAGMRVSLVALLSAGAGAIAVLETLDQYGLLVRLVPEWAAVRNRPQRNAYHRFTVDRHLTEAAANAAARADGVARPDLLLVGTWLHDIGKGFPGDHTDAGVVVIERVARRMGFDDNDVARLVAMVRLHLLLPDVATRRDLDDPVTIETTAAAVGDAVTLELLAALTEADSLATGPSAWSDWKAGLVDGLVMRVGAVLAGGSTPSAAFPSDEHRRRMRDGAVSVAVERASVTVIAPDRPGLLAAVAGALNALGYDVRSAAAGSEDGMAVEVFDVAAPGDGDMDRDRVTADVRAAVEGTLPIERMLGARRHAYAPLARRTAAHRTTPAVVFDDAASGRATVIELRAPDSIGLLYRVATALAELGLDIRSAKLTTLGHEVVDSFYVTELDGTKVGASAERRAAIESAVLAAAAT
jgi:[protein-PII] uridylyltransferase